MSGMDRFIQPEEHKFESTYEGLLEQALCELVEVFPPKDEYGIEVRGCFSGPTSLAYLFLQVEAKHPALLIKSYPLKHWVQAYLAGQRPLVFEPGKRCGISCEALAYPAICAIVNKDLSQVEVVEKRLSETLTDTAPEWLYGRAGALYIARMVCHWFPESTHLPTMPIAALRKSIIADGPKWDLEGLRFYGAAHGDIGNLTQVALSSPLESERAILRVWLSDLLQLQKNGNWPYNEEKDHGHVQFCHGAPGFVQCLLSIRDIFPELDSEIGHAIATAIPVIQQYGILKKEPSLCHGLFGNALQVRLIPGILLTLIDPYLLKTEGLFCPTVSQTWSMS